MNNEVRYYYLDWLRLYAILAVFIHHCSKFFDYHATTVYNAVRSPIFSAFRELNFLWIMPLFFFISGSSVFFSLKNKKAGRFLKERTLRIFLPLVIIGTFVINPPYLYTDRLFSGQTTDGFFQWYPHYFDGIYPKGNFSPLGLGTHLWYLQYLFAYSLILLPLFIRWKESCESCFSKFSAHFEKPWALFFLFVPISFASAIFEIMGLGGVRVVGGWDPLSFLFFFIYGYLVFSNEKIIETIRKYGMVSLIAAACLSVLYIGSHFGIHLDISGVTRHHIHEPGAVLQIDPHIWPAVQAFRGFLAWLWLMGLISLGQQTMDFRNRFLVYGNEAVLPFYILHHTIILIVGLPILGWEKGISIKFIAVLAISFVVIMGIYEVFVRRFKVVRFLFGMKQRHRG